MTVHIVFAKCAIFVRIFISPLPLSLSAEGAGVWCGVPERVRGKNSKQGPMQVESLLLSTSLCIIGKCEATLYQAITTVLPVIWLEVRSWPMLCESFQAWDRLPTTVLWTGLKGLNSRPCWMPRNPFYTTKSCCSTSFSILSCPELAF